MYENTCCFFGHRKINDSKELREKIIKAVERLIEEEKVDTFLFGSKSEFDSLCLEIVSKIKEKYQHIKRVYVRAEFQIIDDNYRKYLLNFYDDTYFPEKVVGAGKASYVKRNYEMVEKSKFCIIYYCSNIEGKSGTKIAKEYAEKKGREIIFVNEE